MLGAAPPSVTIPCTWSPKSACWRRRPIATWAVDDIEVLDGQARHAVELAGRRVHHHGGVQPVETPPLHHEDLPATALLGGRPEDLDRDAEIVGDGRQRPAGPDGSRGDHVVAAGMPDAGKGVVLRADRQHERPRARGGGEGRGQVADSRLDREAGVSQLLGTPGAGALLFETELRLPMDPV